jgi:hypothetical protein
MNANDLSTYIMCIESVNGGRTWSAPFRVSGATNNSQFMPAVSVDPTTGAAAIAWCDCRNDPNNVKTQIYATILPTPAMQGGTPPPGDPQDWEVQVTPQQSDATALAGLGAGFGYGDYMGIAFYGGVFMPVWAGNPPPAGSTTNANNMDIYTACVTLE